MREVIIAGAAGEVRVKEGFCARRARMVGRKGYRSCLRVVTAGGLRGRGDTGGDQRGGRPRTGKLGLGIREVYTRNEKGGVGSVIVRGLNIVVGYSGWTVDWL